ncbi:MAG TPA: hypothetical protein VD836_08005 [Solirubrobacteraceae bacterium]|nr:hypothetical protein [Solirubrobacteraceae bacterium]
MTVAALADGAVTASKLAAGAGAVAAAALADGAVTAYKEIVSGPRNGMFVNTSGNVRDGEAFVLVKRKDHELHIYGTGKDRRVIVSRHQPDGGTTAGDGATGGKTPDDAPAAPATGGVTAPSDEQS